MALPRRPSNLALLLLLILLALCGCQKRIAVRSTRSVDLTWTASATPGVTYNAYRQSGPCATPSTALKLNSSPITALSYTDPSVTAGTWCYWVTSYLTSAETQESAPSNKAEVTVIIQPQPPQNLQVTPPAVTLQTGGTQQFTANLPDALWSIDPADLGTISSTGLYTAPASIKGNNILVQVIARTGLQTAAAQITIRKN